MSTLSWSERWIIRHGDDINCTCEPKNTKHVAGYQCVTGEQIAANLAEHPEFRGSREKLRALTFIETFAP